MHRELWRILIAAWIVGCGSCEYMMAGYLDNSEPSKARLEALEPFSALARTAQLAGLDLDPDADESTITSTSPSGSEDDGIDSEGLRYAIPFPFAFNGGKPFSLEKDPITGKIDFEKAPVNALNYTDRYQESVHAEREESAKNVGGNDRESYIEKKKKKTENDDVSPNEINPYSPNFHDFLNLPVHYSSDKYGKDKYPLISSSYANTKVQSGSNSYSTNNHRPYHRETTLYYPTKKTSSFKSPTTTTTTTRTTTTVTSSTRKSRPTTSPTTMKSTTIGRRTSTTPTVTERSTSPPTTTTAAKTTTTKTSTTSIATTPGTSKSSQRNTPASTRAPVITTWKPSTTSSRTTTRATRRPITTTTSRYDNDYDDMLPIEKLQTSVYNAHQGPSNVLPIHRDDFQIRPDIATDEDYEAYEDYESHGDVMEHDYLPMKDILKETTVKPEILHTTVHYAKQSTTKVPEKVSSTTVTEPTSTSSTTTTTTSPPLSYTPITYPENVFSANPLQLQVLPHRSVTSMPLGDDNREPLPHDNVLDTSLGYRPVQVIPPRRPIDGFMLESTSNIVIPPGQDTVSFVLGNRQNVEDVYYSPGLAIGESPYGSFPEVNPSFKQVYNVAVGATADHPVQQPESQGGNDNQSPMSAHDRRGTVAVPSVMSEPTFSYQNWWPPASPPLKIANDIESSKINVPTYVKDPVVMKHPEMDDQKVTGYVVFPDLGLDRDEDRHVVMVNEDNDTIRENAADTPPTPVTPSETTTGPRVDAMPNDSLPQLAENLTPPAERPRPPYYYHYQHVGVQRPSNNRDYSKPRLPPPPRVIQPYETSFNNGKPVLPPHPDSMNVRRRPPPFNPDTKLPNILPQFRPNAKASHGHRGPENIGTLAAGGQPPFSTRVRQPVPPIHHPPPSRRPFPPSLSHLQRLNPPPPPIQALRLTGTPPPMVDNILPPLQSEIDTKRFRLPSGRDNGDEVAKSALRPNAQKLRQDEEEEGERYSEEPPQLPPRPPLFPKRRTADPPRVATLQMIQQRGEPQPEVSDGVTLVKDVIEAESPDALKNSFRNGIIDPPVYVVYPVNSAVNIHSDDFRDKDETVVVGTHGPHRPLPPDTLLQDDEYEKVDNDGPIVNPIDRRIEPLALGQSADRLIEEPLIGSNEQVPLRSELSYPAKGVNSDSLIFTGPRETPLLVPSDQHKNAVVEKNQDADSGNSVNVIPYLQDFVPFPARKNGNAISATLHRAPVSSTPIAYVYTPSAQISHRLDEDISRLNDKKDEKPILLPSQQPSSSSSSAPSPQNFMAPFVASVSAETPAKNGWSVVVVEPSIDRSSSVVQEEKDEAQLSSGENETQTEKAEFDLDNFKPQLFGGFKPIYEFPADDEQLDRSQPATVDLDTPRHASDESASPAA